MSRYASGTEVPVDRSEVELKRTLARYGADEIITGSSARHKVAMVQFRYKDLPLEIRIPLPDPDDAKFAYTPAGKRERSEDERLREWEKGCRQQWRILLLLIKAQLEAVENGLLKAHEAFLPFLLLPNGQTMGRALEPGLEKFLASGEVPKLLMFAGKGKT